MYTVDDVRTRVAVTLRAAIEKESAVILDRAATRLAVSRGDLDHVTGALDEVGDPCVRWGPGGLTVFGIPVVLDESLPPGTVLIRGNEPTTPGR